ncbi:Small, acid-soluble spore protein gamma-type [Caenorhabditis elegans]|nr:Small, acid-soluble spore protein gamma-type [Caenorhabditis elegans]CAB07626.1 Small, acid-soluble spore protein gamma-type [Caenorhabditis elegans]|eukprot:NP_001256685.1 Uncharacterized protein CELE_F54B8.4 [Caenorhabditis elegans]
MSKEDNNAVVGHQPATKVGGRRIADHGNQRAQNSTNSSDAVREAMDFDLPAKMEKAYPTAAVKQVHEKPTPAIQPAHYNRATGNGQVRNIPQKQNH